MEELSVKIKYIDNINLEELACVYFIQNLDNGLIKIGKTKNIKRRYAEICNQAKFIGISDIKLDILGVIECTNISEVESTLHEKFKKYRVQSEWFKIEKDLLFNTVKSMQMNISHNKEDYDMNKMFLPTIKLNVIQLNDTMYFGNYFNVKLIGIINDETLEIMVGLTGHNDDVMHCFEIDGTQCTMFMYSEIQNKIEKGEYTNHRI